MMMGGGQLIQIISSNVIFTGVELEVCLKSTFLMMLGVTEGVSLSLCFSIVEKSHG